MNNNYNSSDLSHTHKEAMEVQNVLHMNAGDGDTSYAKNSAVQEILIWKAKPFQEDAIRDMLSSSTIPDCFKVADLGCSSGPNTLLAISGIIDTIHGWCQENHKSPPEIQAFLNDLPGSDFNNIFISLPTFYQKLKKQKLGSCFISGVPGSFYGRLFPNKSIHYFQSSSSLHWLSKVPDGVENNKGNICVSKTSTPNIFKAYMEQFEKDFSTFLTQRSKEIVSQGRMVLGFLVRNTVDLSSDDCCYKLLANALLDMVTEGIVEETDLNSFNIPLYTPCKEEVKAIIQEEGSFVLDRIEIVEFNWDPDEDTKSTEDFFPDKYQRGEKVALCIRAVVQSMVVSHFGDFIIDNLFKRYAMHVAHHMSLNKAKHISIIVSLKNK